MVSTVLVDLDGVLKVPDSRWLVDTLGSFGVAISDEQAKSAHYVGIRKFDQAIGESLRDTYDRFYPEGVRDALMLPNDDWLPIRRHLFSGAALKRSVATEQAVRTVHKWAAAGLRVAVITQNRRPGAIEWLTGNGFGIPGQGGPVSLVVESSVVGVSKPDAAIVRFALESLGRPPEEAVYIGDSVKMDAPCAVGAGVRFVHVTPLEDCWCPHQHVPAIECLAL